MQRVLKISLVLGLTVFMTALFAFQIHETPTLAKIKRNFKPTVRLILDRDGQIIDQVGQEKSTHRLPWISVSQLPPYFRDLLEISEGRSLAHRTSSLVQSALGQSNNWLKTWALRSAWSEEQRLEAFVNLAIFNGDFQGLSSVSFALFDKPPQELDKTETALVVGLLHHRLSEAVDLQRAACGLLRDIRAPESCALLTIQHLNSLAKSFSIQPYLKLAPHMALALSTEKQLRQQTLLRSTLDRDAQWNALHALQSSGSEGAIVAMENSTGNILAYVGNSGVKSNNAYRDGMKEPHLAGSMLKPFVYAQALDEHVVTLNTGLETSPNSVVFNLVSVRKALAGNLNVPAIKILELIGADSFLQKLKALGFSPAESAAFYGPSLVLGSNEVTLLELANAYRSFANEGHWSQVRISPDLISEKAPRKAFSKGAVYLVGEILSRNMGTAYWSAGQCLDHWCVGFSEKFTVGVWSDGSASGDMWLKVMGHLQRNDRSQPPVRPDSLVRVGREDYLKGTEPDVELHERGLSGYKSRISFPLDRSLIALAPESKKSGMFIQVVAPRSDQNLYLNGRRLGRAQSLQPWEPEAGKYTLELRDSQGQVIDRVHFVVRGRRFAQNL
jgi:penicillin-binding protein 1C